MDQKFEGDFSIYEGYFMNSGARVFASMPEFNNRMMNISSNLHVIHFRFIIDDTTYFSFKYLYIYIDSKTFMISKYSILLKIGLF